MVRDGRGREGKSRRGASGGERDGGTDDDDDDDDDWWFPQLMAGLCFITWSPD